jgi:hypothetical protein
LEWQLAMAFSASIKGQIVIWIASEARALTDDQRKEFAKWLASHCNIEHIDVNSDLVAYLTAWFDGLPVDRLVSELSLFLGEISWWQRKTSYEISLISRRRMDPRKNP